jgi:hypothetical protein
MWTRQCLGLLLFSGRGLDQDERLNAGGQVIGVGHSTKFQGQRNCFCERDGRPVLQYVLNFHLGYTDCHRLVKGALEDITLL